MSGGSGMRGARRGTTRAALLCALLLGIWACRHVPVPNPANTYEARPSVEAADYALSTPPTPEGVDAGVQDAGAPDMGVPDMGPPDQGAPDAGTAGVDAGAQPMQWGVIRPLDQGAPQTAAAPAVPQRLDRARLTLINETHDLVCYVHMTQEEGRRAWGEDRLDPEEMLAPGDSRDFWVRPGPWRIRALDCNRTAIYQREPLEVGPTGGIIRLRVRE